MRPELKGDAWQPKLETVTQDTHTVDVSQVISMQSKGGVKLLGRGSLAEECRQGGGEKLEQNVKRYCDEAELLPTSPCGGSVRYTGVTGGGAPFITTNAKASRGWLT